MYNLDFEPVFKSTLYKLHFTYMDYYLLLPYLYPIMYKKQVLYLQKGRNLYFN